MRYLTWLLPALLAAASTLAYAQPEPAPPTRQMYEEDLVLTDRKIQALSTEMGNLDATVKLLQEYGDPAKVQPGESTKDYLRRVNKIMKARGHTVHLLHQRFEGALDAKFQLQTQLDEYVQWVEATAKRLKKYPEEYRVKAQQLDAALIEKRNDGRVLAHLICQAAQEAGDQEK